MTTDLRSMELFSLKKQRSIGATDAELLAAAARIRAELAEVAEKAYQAIQKHSFATYYQFASKRTEHAAVICVIRSRCNEKKPELARAAAQEEFLALKSTVQSVTKFLFALSAVPSLPIGASETFLSEYEYLKTTREKLTLDGAQTDQEKAAIRDDIETALMLLEEILGKAPTLEEFS